MKRVMLLILTNVAIMAMLSLVIHLFGVNRWLAANGINYGALLGFCAVFGFGGAFVSLWVSKPMAKWSTRARVIDGSEGAPERWLVDTVGELADRAAIGMPEVAIYEGEPNAFATGATKNSALVAVSTGLLATMSQDQVKAVLAHEVAHISNSDLVTLTLIQGVVNTFVMFLARIVGYAVDKVILKNNSDRPGIGYSLTVFVLDLVFGLFASIIVAWFSRRREFRADAGAAQLMGDSRPMISALQALASMNGASSLPKNMQAFGISGGMRSLFSTHPPLQERIAALSN